MNDSYSSPEATSSMQSNTLIYTHTHTLLGWQPVEELQTISALTYEGIASGHTQ